MKLQTAVSLGRVSNLPTVWSNVLAAVVLAGPPLSPTRLVVLCLIFSGFYVGGMFLNDAFDADYDRRWRPTRPIPTGRASTREVAIWGGIMIVSSVLAIAVDGVVVNGRLPGMAIASALALSAVIVWYDKHHKNNPFSPLLMGLCRVGVYVTAGLAVAPALPERVLWGGGLLLCYLMGLTFAAKQEDLLQVKSWWPLVLLGVPLAWLLGQHSLPLAALGLGFVVWCSIAVHVMVGRRREISRGVAMLIAAIAWVDALAIGATGNLALAGCALLAVPLTQLSQRFVSGT